MGHSIAVLGASGYAGGEILRLLGAHPDVEVTTVSADRHVGRSVGELHPHLRACGNLPLVSAAEVAAAGADVVFSCLPSAALSETIHEIDAGTVIDLSDDHRADPQWVYGLTEFVRDRFPASNVANPGCYPTAALLCLVPFMQAGAIGEELIVDAMSGVSGAGRSGADHLSFAALHGDATAYGTTAHRHVGEMKKWLSAFGGVTDVSLSFTPHLVPLARGLLVTARARLVAELDDKTAMEILKEAYATEPFVSPIEGWPSVKAVAGSNSALVSARVDTEAGWLICSAAIDNLGKGAAGQAIQNMNLCLGLDEGTGLTPTGLWP
jgi:N-acetyl-gamma-glutamyl-phosphate reductase